MTKATTRSAQPALHPGLTAIRAGLALLGLAAIITQLSQSIWLGRDLGNFFSFFTIESNILAVALLTTLVFLRAHTPNFTLIRGAITLYMTMTGVIYIILLSGNEAALQTTVPWVNMVLHYILPVAILLDWLLIPPPVAVPLRRALWWLAFPALYLVYSLVRGAFTGWYPYPFINPVTNGWVAVIGMSFIITLGSALLAIALARRYKRAAHKS